MTKRLATEGVSFPVLNVAVYFFHSAVIRGTLALAQAVVPSLLSRDTVRGPLELPLPFAQNEARYVVSGLTGMPQNPSFAAPTRPLPDPDLTSSFSAVVRAVSGTGLLSSEIDPSPPPSF